MTVVPRRTVNGVGSARDDPEIAALLTVVERRNYASRAASWITSNTAASAASSWPDRMLRSTPPDGFHANRRGSASSSHGHPGLAGAHARQVRSAPYR